MYQLIIFILICISSISLEAKVIVTVHGFLRGEANFKRLGKYFSKKGHNVFPFIYNSKGANVEQHAQDLIQHINSIEKIYPNEELAIVTHSLGGIVTRCALSHPECSEKMKNAKMVFIAPPNQGSIFARSLAKIPLINTIFGAHSGKQLCSEEFFETIPAYLFKEKQLLIIAGTFGFNPFIQGKNDGKVATTETLLFSNHDYIEIRAGHSWICEKQSTIKHAYQFIVDPHSI